ncbi:hypothetical protein [Hymenobacter radiodurans]|uniref:hypothetical protein n=1 Tax=Hymenobacter radiodurans TaxID=2496028 RepID=UPI00105846D6|nr:hypothetical protein [Hymenobacter radiodurans]
MRHHFLFFVASLLIALPAAAQTTSPTPAAIQAPADTLTAASEPVQARTAVQLPWWLPTAAQCADIRALEAIEAPKQAARREKRMQQQSKKLAKKYPQATE